MARTTRVPRLEAVRKPDAPAVKTQSCPDDWHTDESYMAFCQAFDIKPTPLTYTDWLNTTPSPDLDAVGEFIRCQRLGIRYRRSC